MLPIPDWARRHNYYWHSNPKSKTRSKTLFDKCVVRPKLKKAWEIVRGDSSLPEDVDDAWVTIYRFDQSYNGSDNANMLGGRVTQSACDMILIERKDPAAVLDWAHEKFMKYVPRNWDDGADANKWSQYITEIPDIIRNSVEGLKEAMHDQEIFGETELYGRLPHNELGHKNLPDYVGVGDLKTKWSRRNPRTKSGFASNSLPKDLSGQYEMANVYQVAGGWWVNGKKPVWLLYVNKDDYRLFNQSNCDQLQPEFLEQVVEDTSRHHKVTEKMLMLSDSTIDLMDLISPEWNELCWQEPPGYLEEARRVFKVRG
jgi:hypothetical protein